MWQRKTNGERISAHTQTQARSSRSVWGSVKAKGSLLFFLLREQSEEQKKKKKTLALTFHTDTPKCLKKVWRSPPLDKLTCSTGEHPCLPQLPRFPSSQTSSVAKSHSSIFLQGAALASTAPPDRWPIQRFAGWWWDPCGLNYTYFFPSLYYSTLFM